jgi:hypothetical protein
MEKEEIRAKYGCCGDYDNCQHSCTSKGQYLEANRQREKRYKHYDNRLAAWEEVDPIIKNDAALCFAVGFDLGAASQASPPEKQPLTDDELKAFIDDKYKKTIFMPCAADKFSLGWYKKGFRDGESYTKDGNDL